MRLYERTLKWVKIAPRSVKTDALGGVTEEFSPERRAVRASLIPTAGGLKNREAGVEQVQTMCLLLPKDAKLEAGDGVCAEGDEPQWRCVNVEHWSAHIAAQLERIAGC